MSDFPFGFNRPEDPDDGRNSGSTPNPLGAFGSMNPQDLSSMLHHFADLMSWQGGPVNWDLAKDVARHALAGEDDPSVTEAEQTAVSEALRLGDLWLDDTTALPSGISVTEAWSRADWIEKTLPVWSQLCDPIANRAVESMGSIVPQEMQQVAGPLFGIMRQVGGMMIGGQTGQALGALVHEVVGSTDVGLPLSPAGHAALLPAGIRAFGAGLGVDEEQVRLYLALREAAHHRLFAHVPWLRAHLLGAVEEYARGITVDTQRIEEAVAHIDPNDPESLQEALTGEGLFQAEDTPQQKAALARLETALALVEGWVDTVVSEAAESRLPAVASLTESVRRKRATGGPAERTFSTLVGLELRPRRMREAAQLWRSLQDERGIEGRDALWEHPDLMPSADDLDDPEGFARRRDSDIEIPSLDTMESPGEPETDGPSDTGEGDDHGGPAGETGGEPKEP